MEILNKNGMILMDYRREFKRHYADSVDEALKDAILTLYKEGQIPEKLFRIILDDNIDDSVVYTYLLSRREFTKSSMELNSEFNEVRERVNDYLIKINFVKNVCTKNSVNTNRIYVIKQYDIPKELLLSYFGLTPSEIIPLMKRKGFMDKFCVLRLSQAFKEIYTELRVPEHIDHGYSLIYYNKLIQGFSIDYKYMVNVNYINDEERLCDLMDKIKKLDEVVERKFESKMSYSYFQQLDKKMSASELAAEIDKIVIPVRSGKRSQDIRKPELIVEEAEIMESKDEKPADKPVETPVVEVVEEPKATSPILVVDEDDDLIIKKPEKSNDKPEQTQAKVEQPKQEKKEPPKQQKSNEQPKQNVAKPVETPKAESVKKDEPSAEQPKAEQTKHEQPKQQPHQQGQGKNGNKNGQQNNNQQKQNNQNGKNNQQKQGQGNNQNQGPKNDKQPDNRGQQKPADKPVEKVEVKPEQRQNDSKPKAQQEVKPEVKPEIKSDVKADKPAVKNEPEDIIKIEEKKEPPKQQAKPKNDFDDDDDDLLGDVIVPVKTDKKKPANNGDSVAKPTLVIDDSDTDLI